MFYDKNILVTVTALLKIIIIPFSQTADELIAESGCMLEHPAAAQFRSNIMNGEWNKVKIFFKICDTQNSSVTVIQERKI